MSNSIVVRGLSWTTSRFDLRQYFNQFGRVVRSEILYDKETGMSKRVGFVNFSTPATAQEVVGRRGHTIEGNRVYVLSREQSQRPRRAE